MSVATGDEELRYKLSMRTMTAMRTYASSTLQTGKPICKRATTHPSRFIIIQASALRSDAFNLHRGTSLGIVDMLLHDFFGAL